MPPSRMMIPWFTGAGATIGPGWGIAVAADAGTASAMTAAPGTSTARVRRRTVSIGGAFRDDGKMPRTVSTSPPRNHGGNPLTCRAGMGLLLALALAALLAPAAQAASWTPPSVLLKGDEAA